MDSFHPYTNSGDSQRLTHPTQPPQPQQIQQRVLSQFNNQVLVDQSSLQNKSNLSQASGSVPYGSNNGYSQQHLQRAQQQHVSQQQPQMRQPGVPTYSMGTNGQSSYQPQQYQQPVQQQQHSQSRPPNVYNYNNAPAASSLMNQSQNANPSVPDPLGGPAPGPHRTADQTELLRSMYQSRHQQQTHSSSSMQQPSMAQQQHHMQRAAQPQMQQAQRPPSASPGIPPVRRSSPPPNMAYYHQNQPSSMQQQQPQTQQGYQTSTTQPYTSQGYHVSSSQGQTYTSSRTNLPPPQINTSTGYAQVPPRSQQVPQQRHPQMLHQEQSHRVQQQQRQQLSQPSGYPPQQSQQQIPQRPHQLPVSHQHPQSSSQQKQRFNLTPEAKSALREAVLSAIRNNGDIDPILLQRAMAQGLPKQAIINAAIVARDRDRKNRDEREKKRLQQQQQQQQQASTAQVITGTTAQIHPTTIPPRNGQANSQTATSNPNQYSTNQQRQQQLQQIAKQQLLNKRQLEKAAAEAVLRDRQQEEQKKKQQLQLQQQREAQRQRTEEEKKKKEADALRAAADAEAKRNASLMEKMKPWGRTSFALVVGQGSKGCEVKSNSAVASTLVHPNSCWGGATRCSDDTPALLLAFKRIFPEATIDKKFAVMHAEKITSLASQLREKLIQQNPQALDVLVSKDKAPPPHPTPTQLRKRRITSISSKLIESHPLKRFKLQPKREGKFLEKHIRRARTLAADATSKRHKDLLKAIITHQAEFYKFHRMKKTEAARLARTIRDHLNKAEKQKEKEADQAERARIAALRSNDMAAYTSLLEDTKNERLKFLLDKTDECMNQISSLLASRAEEEQEDIMKMGGEGANVTRTFSKTAVSGNYYEMAHVKSEQVRQPSILVGGDLKEYQLSGLQWLVSLYNNRLNGILADEMGLGKTIQTISLIAYLMEMKENPGPYLVIVPLSTLSNWVNEFSKWLPAATVICYKGTPQQRRDIFRNEVLAHFNVLLTTYEFVIRDKGSLRKLEWQYAIVDEGHRMKNNQSKFAVTLGTQYTTRRRVLLTGTPLQNNLPELWALLNFLLPAIFNSAETFDQWFNKPFSSFGKAASNENSDTSEELLSNEERMLIIHRLHELLRPFMLRRVKSEVLDQLPEKVEKVLRCELSSWQKELYKQISTKIIGEAQGKNFNRGLNNVVMQLRKVCNHPFLFTKEGYHINDDIIRSSGKFELLDRMLPKLKAAGHRVLMFTQMVKMMPILEDYFAYRGFTSIRLDGSTTADEREKRMYMFNAPDSPYFIFLLSTRAGGLGLNLATADTVIIFDSDWNPMMDLQAQDRAHRIGQRKDVRVFRIVTQSPVEEKILGRATEKLRMNELVVEAGKFDKAGQDEEEGSSLERLKMMELLLTDFDNSQYGQSTSGGTSEEDYDKDADEGEEDDGRDLLNEMISSNDDDYKVYCEMDLTNAPAPSLYTDIETVPDWIRYPNGKPEKDADLEIAAAAFPHKRRAAEGVVYDDGMTEKQFCRMMDKQAADEEKGKKKRKKKRSRNAVDPSLIIDDFGTGRKRAKVSPVDQFTSTSRQKPVVIAGDKSGNAMVTPEINERLISITRSIIYFKEKGTNRKVSEIFLEKPCPTTYPDYYQLIENPIGMNDILRKCRTNLYSTVNDFRDDWNTLFRNALTYNGEGSWVVIDADTLKAEFNRLMDKNTKTGTDTSKKPLRIKLSLKKTTPKSDTSDNISSTKSLPSSEAVNIQIPQQELSDSGASSDSEDDSDEDGIYSDIVGMDQRTASQAKRSKNRPGGLGSRGGTTREYCIQCIYASSLQHLSTKGTSELMCLEYLASSRTNS
ncbi:hypothetical protein ACHAW6_015831 [Cyclotella cf. meneghiniana]